MIRDINIREHMQGRVILYEDVVVTLAQ